MSENELHNIPPRKRLEDIEKLLKRVRSIRTLRSRVCEYLHCGGSDVKEFHYKINNHDWKGIIYLQRNSLMGTIFSLFDAKVVIIRGFPKIKYTHQSKVSGKYCIAEEKLDGTNIGIWEMPDGSIMGKTRMVERWDIGSGRAGAEGSWKAKFEKTPGYRKVYELAKKGYIVFVELYGYHNSGEFVKYSVPLAYKVIGVVDRRHYNFVPRGNKSMLCGEFGLPLPSVHFEGTLDVKQVMKLEAGLEEFLVLDGMEGLVAKYWDENDLDFYFSKIKTDKVKEQCYKISRSIIPANIIRKAVKKALDENPGETQMGILLKPTIDELGEEYDESMLENSMGKIKGILRATLTPSDSELKASILQGMEDLRNLGIEVLDPKQKGKVLSSLHDMLPEISGATLYKIYLEVTLEMKGKW